MNKEYYNSNNTPFNDIVKEAYDCAYEKGFHDQPKHLSMDLMLVVSELSEALEADRNDYYCEPDEVDHCANLEHDGEFELYFDSTINNTVQCEIADAIIRLVDIAATQDWDILKVIKLKQRFNRGRKHKHGKRY